MRLIHLNRAGYAGQFSITRRYVRSLRTLTADSSKKQARSIRYQITNAKFPLAKDG